MAPAEGGPGGDGASPRPGPAQRGTPGATGGGRGPTANAVSAPSPVWATVSARLLSEMADGSFPNGARLPPERELAAQHGVAVGTVRRALADLQSRGLLVRRQGSGNYVRTAGLSRELYGFFRLEPVAGDGVPSADLLDAARLPTPADTSLPSPEATRIRRLRRLGGVPAALEEIWLDGAHRLDPAAIGDSLYLTYRAQLGLEIVAVEDRVGVAPMPGWGGPLAHGLPVGRPSGYVEREGRAKGGAVAEVSRTWFDPDRARYVTRQGALRP